MESDDEDATPPKVEPAANPPEAMEEESISPPSGSNAALAPVTTTERLEPETGTREDQLRVSIFSGLGEEDTRT